jgi:hypothetical protein
LHLSFSRAYVILLHYRVGRKNIHSQKMEHFAFNIITLFFCKFNDENNILKYINYCCVGCNSFSCWFFRCLLHNVYDDVIIFETKTRKYGILLHFFYNFTIEPCFKFVVFFNKIARVDA